MNNGQRQPPDSRFTIATVLMHWQASTKNTISETPASGRHQRRAAGPGRPAQHLAQRLVGLVGVRDVEDHAQGADEHFASGERPEDAHADAPIEAERGDDRLDDASEAARHAVPQLRAALLAVDLRQPRVALVAVTGVVAASAARACSACAVTAGSLG